MTLSTTEANKILSHIFGGTSYTPEATWFVALFTASPTIAGLGDNEVSTSGTAYARVSVTNNSTNFPAAASQAGANGAAFTFPTATAAWGTITHLGLCATTTEGADDVRHFGALTTPAVINSGATPSFAVGDIDWTAT